MINPFSRFFVFSRLFWLNFLDMFAFLNLRNIWLAIVVSPFFVFPSLYVSWVLLVLNKKIENVGFREGLVWALHRYYSPSYGSIPPEEAGSGPLLVVCNHPGLGDFLALLERLGRNDVKVIVKQRDLMRDLENILSQCLVIEDSVRSRAQGILQGIEHIKSGGVLVIFPAGEIEEDPDLVRGESFFKPWFPIVDGLSQRCIKLGIPLRILPAVADRVYHVPGFLHGFVEGGTDEVARSGRAAIITMVLPKYRKKRIRIRFLDLIQPEKIPRVDRGDHGITNQIRGDLTCLLKQKEMERLSIKN